MCVFLFVVEETSSTSFEHDDLRRGNLLISKEDSGDNRTECIRTLDGLKILKTNNLKCYTKPPQSSFYSLSSSLPNNVYFFTSFVTNYPKVEIKDFLITFIQILFRFKICGNTP